MPSMYLLKIADNEFVCSTSKHELSAIQRNYGNNTQITSTLQDHKLAKKLESGNIMCRETLSKLWNSMPKSDSKVINDVMDFLGQSLAHLCVLEIKGIEMKTGHRYKEDGVLTTEQIKKVYSCTLAMVEKSIGTLGEKVRNNKRIVTYFVVACFDLVYKMYALDESCSSIDGIINYMQFKGEYKIKGENYNKIYNYVFPMVFDVCPTDIIKIPSESSQLI